MRAARPWLLALAGLCLGCAARPGAPVAQAVVVTSLALDFPARDTGELAFSLRLLRDVPAVASVSWELFLDGARFAAGIDGDVALREGVLSVRSALVSRHLAWREGEGWLDVSLQGEVDLGGGRERMRFRDRRELLVHSRPQLNIPLD